MLSKDLIKIIAYFLTVFIVCFKPGMYHNEYEVIPYAFQQYDRSWLPNDWFLNLNLGHRILFNYIFGPIVSKIGFNYTIILGRILSYFLFSISVYYLFKKFKFSLFEGIIILMTFLILYEQTLGSSSEWMIGAIETKVFSYVFIILSITEILKSNYKLFGFYSGVALSFHPLIGVYCFIIGLLTYIITNRNTSFIDIVKLFICFSISGIIGIYSILVNLNEALLTNSENDIWNFYIYLRNPHHLIPRIDLKLVITYLAVSLVFILRKNLKPQTSNLKPQTSNLKPQTSNLNCILIYINLCLLLWGLGYLIYKFGDRSLLRFYFFRVPDTMVPLLSSIVFICVGKTYINLKKILFIYLIIIFYNNYFKILIPVYHVISGKSDLTWVWDQESSNWIKNNTNKNDIFIVPPLIQSFTINTERPNFISFKNVPQSPNDLKEWVKRLKMLNKGLEIKSIGFNAIDEIMQNYLNLSEDEVCEIEKTYGVKYLIFPTIENEKIKSKRVLKLPYAFKGKNFIIYSL